MKFPLSSTLIHLVYSSNAVYIPTLTLQVQGRGEDVDIVGRGQRVRPRGAGDIPHLSLQEGPVRCAHNWIQVRSAEDH